MTLVIETKEMSPYYFLIMEMLLKFLGLCVLQCIFPKF